MQEYEVSFIRKTYHEILVEAETPQEALDKIVGKCYDLEPCSNDPFLVDTLDSKSNHDPYYDLSVEAVVTKYRFEDHDGTIIARQPCNKAEPDSFEVIFNNEYAEEILKILKEKNGYAGESTLAPYKLENQFYPIKNSDKNVKLKVMYNRIMSAMLDYNVDIKSQQEILFDEYEELFQQSDYDLADYKEPLGIKDDEH